MKFTLVTLLFASTAFAIPQPQDSGDAGDPPADVKPAAAPTPTGPAPPPPPPPPKPYTHIHPYASSTKCLDVRSARFENGTPVQVYDCNGTPAQRWVIDPAHSRVRLYNTNFCLDAGSDPKNGVGMKIWQCYDNLPAQEWYFKYRHFNLVNTNLCLDLTDGNLANWNQVQTWQCYPGNNNQRWYTD